MAKSILKSLVFSGGLLAVLWFVPQSVHAALTVGATSISTDSTLSLQGGNVGIGDLTPVGALVVGDDTTAGVVNGAGDLYVQNDLEVDGSIATVIGSSSLVFANSTGVLSGDNSNLIWDNTNKRLGIGGSPSGTLHIQDVSSSTTSVVKNHEIIDVVDFGNTTSGTDYNTGIWITLDKSGSTGGTLLTRGQLIQVASDNAGAGSSTAIGQTITVTGTADTTYGLLVTVPTYATSYAATFSGGNVGIGTTTPAEALDVNSDSIRIRTAQSPATAAACNQGDIAWATDYIYVCVATNDWRRSALADY